MEEKKTILIVEDDADINALLHTALTKAGYDTIQAYSGTEGKLVVGMQERKIDLILLDLMLPGMSGEELLSTIRAQGQTPVIVLTAKDELDDKISVLSEGADDYITKPFDPAQLVARVKAHLKRYQRLTGKNGENQKPERLEAGDVVLEPKTWKVWKKGVEIRLPNREFELLRFLAQNPGIVFSKEELFEQVWGYDYVSDAATVSVHINRLREKIEDDPRNPRIIETVWGAGYRLNKQ